MHNDQKELTTLAPYWMWEEGLSLEICDLLLKERDKLEQVVGVIGTGDGAEDKTSRNSNVCWAPTNHWIEGILYNYGLYACESTGWGFHLGRPERVQLTAYDKEGFYGWHEDWAPLASTPVVRKISVVALLSDPSEFEGGEFQFANDADGATVKMKRGSVLAFPSFLRHQVTPIISGKRYSAVCWINGPRTF